MVRDAFGDRMKKYECVSRTYLTPRMPVIIRLDGKAFHTFTQGFKCLTELEPEELDGITLTGIWFCSLSDAIAHSIGKKYHLYT